MARGSGRDRRPERPRRATRPGCPSPWPVATRPTAIALEHFRRDLVIETKPDRTFVTQADTAIERTIRGLITGTYPDHGLVGEEYGTEDGTGTVRWYIDPIDGTHNFMRGVPLFGTLLAVEEDGEIVAGVMSAPALGERWYARRGGGAWAVGSVGPRGRGRRAGSASRGSGRSPMPRSSIRRRSTSRRAGRRRASTALVRSAWRDRGFGDFWGYALVAEGAAEAMVEVGPNSWDLAAPSIVVEEAGGRMTDIRGERIDPRRDRAGDQRHPPRRDRGAAPGVGR